MLRINENMIKILKWIALISGSVLCIFFTGLVLFGGAYFIDGLTNETPLQINQELVLEFLGLLTAILIIVSVVISWFKSKLGGLLITVFVIVHIIAVNEPEILWMPISIIPVGLILLLSPSKSRLVSKDQEA